MELRMAINTQIQIDKSLTMPDLAEFMTTTEAAKVLGFNKTSIRNMVYNGTLECQRFGRSLLVSRKSVHEYLKKTKGMAKNDPRRGKSQD
jgi:excisionase family DNA binding protein